MMATEQARKLLVQEILAITQGDPDAGGQFRREVEAADLKTLGVVRERLLDGIDERCKGVKP